ncbi:hypothetical protein KAI87_11240, partial [Myxococcota bacterium]|nr:hypothetical protein [Myxococcota bacterium]
MSSIKGGSPSPVIQHPVSDPVDTGAGNTGVKGKSTSPNSVKTPDSHAKTSDSHVKSNDSHAAPHVEGHDAHGDHLDHNVHTLHQVKLEVHGAETFAEGLAHVAKSEGSILKGLQGTVQGEAKLLQMAQKGVQSGRAMAVVGEAAKELSATDLAKLDKATGSIEKFSTLQDKVIKASKTQSKAALKLNALLSKGAEPKIIAQARENLDTAARNASSINNRLEKLRPNLAQAKSTVRAIAQQVHEGKKSLGLMA